MTSDTIIGGGFTVAVDELLCTADALTRAHDDELDHHQRDRQRHHRPGGPTAEAGRLAAAEREWSRRHAPLLADLAAAGPALRATADTYLRVDDRIAQLDAGAGSRVLAAGAARRDRGPVSTARHNDEAARPDPACPDPTWLDAAAGSDANRAADDDAAIEELRRRWRARALRADTVAVALQTSRPEHWRGPAAEAFDHWRHRSRTGWSDLVDLADTVAATLTTTTAPLRRVIAAGHHDRTATPVPINPPPADPILTDPAPTDAAGSVAVSGRPTEAGRTNTAPVGGPSPKPPSPPQPDGVTVTVTGPHTHVSVDVREEKDHDDRDDSAREDGDREDGHAGSAQAPTPRPPAPGHTPPDDTHPHHDDHPSAAAPIPGPDNAATSPPLAAPTPEPPLRPDLSPDPGRPAGVDNTVGVDNTAASTSTGVTGGAAGTGPGPADAGPDALGWGIGITAAAAAAAAMLLARRDRHPRPAPIAGHHPDRLTGPVVEPGPDAPRSHPRDPGPAGHRAVGNRRAIGRHPEPGPARRWQPDIDGEPHLPHVPRAGSNPTRARPPDRGDCTHPASRWLHIGTHIGGPVLLDPTATGGIGLTGPGAPNVARALLLTLAATGQPLTAVAAPDTAHTLLDTAPNPRPATPHRAGGTGWHILRDPLTALHATEHEIQQRHHRRTARPHPARDGWWVLVVAAPTTSAAADRLRAALAAGARYSVTAIIAGHWPHGWNATIDTEHRITHHTPTGPHSPAPHRPDLYRPDLYRPDLAQAVRPANLAGAHLFHATAAELRTPLVTPVTAITQPTSHDTGPSGFPPTTRTASDPTDNHPGPGGEDVDQVGEPVVFDLPTVLAANRPHRPTHHKTPDPATDNDPAARPDVAATTAPTGPRLPTGPPPARVAPMRLSILGPATLTHLTADSPGREQVIDGIGPRAMELLVYLAVHPHGVARDTLIAALWPDAGPDRPTNALNAALTRLRRVLRATDPDHATLVTLTGDRYHLDADLVDIDYWTFLIAAADLTHPDPQRRVHACDTVIHTYQGPVAVDLTGEWLITLREAARRRYLDALTTLARHIVDHDPIRTLGLLETARNLEPLNEGVYRDIMRIQARLHRYDAATATLALLHAQLADIGATPDPATLDLADTITNHARHDPGSDTRSA